MAGSTLTRTALRYFGSLQGSFDLNPYPPYEILGSDYFGIASFIIACHC